MRRTALALAMLLAGQAVRADFRMGLYPSYGVPVYHTTVYPSAALTAYPGAYAAPAMSYAPAFSYATAFSAAPVYLPPLYAAPIYAPPAAPQTVVLTAPSAPQAMLLTAPTAPAGRTAATAPDPIDAAISRITKQMEQLGAVVEKHTATLKDHEQRIQAAESKLVQPIAKPMPLGAPKSMPRADEY